MTRAPGTPEGLFAERVEADPTRPFLTFYDDATSERVELSARSMANWVAKTHYYLLDELGLSRVDKAFVTLPVHWLAAPILLGCWSAGLEVVSDAHSCEVAFGDLDGLLAADVSDVDEVLAVSLLSMARSSTPPAPMSDYAASVRPQPDSWAGVRAQAGPEEPALNGRTRAGVVQAGLAAAEAMALTSGGRLLWTKQWQSSDDWIAALVAPLAVGASIVLVRNPDPSSLQAKASSERVTATARP